MRRETREHWIAPTQAIDDPVRSDCRTTCGEQRPPIGPASARDRNRQPRAQFGLRVLTEVGEPEAPQQAIGQRALDGVGPISEAEECHLVGIERDGIAVELLLALREKGFELGNRTNRQIDWTHQLQVVEIEVLEAVVDRLLHSRDEAPVGPARLRGIRDEVHVRPSHLEVRLLREIVVNDDRAAVDHVDKLLQGLRLVDCRLNPEGDSWLHVDVNL